MSKNRLILYFLPLAILLIAMACNMPLRGQTISQADLVKTASAGTLQAQLTEINQPLATLEPVEASPQPSETPLGTITPTITPLPTEPAATEVVASPTPKASPTPICNRAAFITDVTVKDNTEFAPGETFIKTWRLKNVGVCAWDADSSLVVDGENNLSAPGAVAFTEQVIDPGETVDVSVKLQAPDLVGTYRTSFRLRSSSGETFGTTTGRNFWAQIEVVVAKGLTYDFNNQAGSAAWKSGTGDSVETTLEFGGDMADPNGTATVVDGVPLENGGTSGKLLLTIPKRTKNGFIQGVFPTYLVQPGDHLKARVGFMIPSGSGVCGTGKLRFELRYKVGDKATDLGEWSATCDGSLTAINIDLSNLKGKKIQFILIVRSVGEFLDNFGVWNSLSVVHE